MSGEAEKGTAMHGTIGEAARAAGLVQPPAEAPALPWQIVRRIGKNDRHALTWLARLGYRTYYPVIREMRPVPRKRLSVRQRHAGIPIVLPKLVPFAPGYIFVQFNMDSGTWSQMKDLCAIGGFAATEGTTPVQVPDTLIANLREREKDGFIDGDTTLAELFRFKEWVRVKAGPFAGFNGSVEELAGVPIAGIDSETRIRIAVELFGQPTPVDIPVSDLEKL